MSEKAKAAVSADPRYWAEAARVLERAAKAEPYDVVTMTALKSACEKLGDRQRLLSASKQLALALMAGGQMDRALAEYQMLAKELPMDPEVTDALRSLRSGEKKTLPPPPAMTASRLGQRVSEGNKRLGQFLIEEHLLKSNEVWLLLYLLSEINGDLNGSEPKVPFLMLASARNGIPMDALLLALADRFRLPYVPLENYEVENEALQRVPLDTAGLRCVVAFDRIGRKTMIATANPFDEDVRSEVNRLLEQQTLWYLASPVPMLALLRRLINPETAKG